LRAFHNIGLWFLAAFFELRSLGEYQFSAPPNVIWGAAMAIFGTSLLKMGLSGTVRYFVKHWYRLLIAALAGIAIPLMLAAPWKPFTLQLPSALFSAPAITSLALILVLGIVSTSEKLTDYWRRYLRTLCIPDPPAQPTLVISTAVLLSGPIFYFFPPPFSLSFPNAKWPVLALELGLWIAAPLLMAVIEPESKVLSNNAGRKKQELSRDYSDEPIATEEHDLLGRRDFAHRLADEIIELPGKDSFVFGLIARWGEGKTSVLNLVKRKLESCPDAIIVDFNPWYFASEIGILEALYGSIERAIEARFLLPSFKRRIRRYLKTLSIGLDHKPFSLDLELPENPDQLRRELEGFIARTGARLVIFLDDIDRLDRDLALGALALSRLSARFQNTVFLLAFDADELKNKQIDQSFLEKIIQKQIVLPPADVTSFRCDGFEEVHHPARRPFRDFIVGGY
jgi:KAP family P-loop domain